MKQSIFVKLAVAADGFVLICGRYEGVDARVAENLVDEELSLGDYVLLGGEVGRHFALAQGWDFQVFGGIGSDLIRPFVSDDLVLGSLHTSLGIGMRSHLMMDEGWVWGMDLRREWIADRNEDSVNLGGTAWSLRFVIEWLSQRGRPYEVELLTH